MHDLVTTLVHLHPNALHVRAGEAAKHQAGAAWELAACLIAVERSESFRAFDCTSVVDYAERCLGLGPCKALELLRGGRVLERFPKLSGACRDGRLCWSKMREVARAVQPETEEQWLAFAVTHTSREIERAVSVSAAQYRREQAATASAAGRSAPADAAEGGGEPASPSRTSGGGEPASPGRTSGGGGEQLSLASAGGPQVEVPASLAGSDPNATATATVGRSASAETVADAAPSPVHSPPAPVPQPAPPRPPAPVPPRLVRVEMHLTPDQFAIWDKALDRVRSARSRHVSKEVALEALARHYLAGGDARTRTHHPVVLRADPATGTTWYETSRGILPASAEATEDALARERGIFVAAAGAAADLATVAAAPRERAQSVAVATSRARSHEPEPMAAGEQAEGSQEPAAQQDRHHESASGHESAAAPPADAPPGPRPGTPRRQPVPASRRRAALVRANHRCERCGATGRLEVDHVTAVCDGGSDLALQIRCHDCHADRHAEDFAGDPRYVRGRAEGIARQERRMPDLTASG